MILLMSRRSPVHLVGADGLSDVFDVVAYALSVQDSEEELVGQSFLNFLRGSELSESCMSHSLPHFPCAADTCLAGTASI